MKEIRTLIVRRILPVLILSFGVVIFSEAAFQEPASPFPGGNPSSPLDTSALPQTRAGNLTLDPGNIIFGGGARPILQLQPGQFLSVGAGFQFIPSISNQTILRNSAGAFFVDALGFRLPNNTPSNITSPGEGTLIFNTASNRVEVFDGSTWGVLGGGGGTGGGSQWSDISSGGIYYSGGNVGIGLSNPQSALDVSGDIRVGGQNNQPSYSLVLGIGVVDSYGNVTPTVQNPGNDTTPDDDAVNPYTCASDDQGDFVDWFRAFDANGRALGYASQDVSCVLDSSTYRVNNSFGTLQFTNSQNEVKFVLGQDGHVGIGILTPQQTLDVSGNVKARGFCIGNDCRSDWSSFGSQWSSGSNGVIYYTGGRVGVGTNAPGADFDVSGTLKASTICIGTDCRSQWPSGGISNDPTPVMRNYPVKFTSLKRLAVGNVWQIGIANESQTMENMLNWTTITNKNSQYKGTPHEISALYGGFNLGNNVEATIEETYDLDPNKAVVGVRLFVNQGGTIHPSHSDDGGVCVAGVKGYFFGAVSHDGYFTGLDLDGNLTNSYHSGRNADNMKNWTFLMDHLKSGAYAWEDPTDKEAAYAKSPGVSLIPPGKQLTVKGKVINRGGASEIYCRVQVAYSE